MINKKLCSIEVGWFLLIDKIYTFTGGWYSGLWTLIGCTLCVLSMKTIGSDSFFECVISHGMTQHYYLLFSLYVCAQWPFKCLAIYFFTTCWMLNCKINIVHKIQKKAFIIKVLFSFLNITNVCFFCYRTHRYGRILSFKESFSEIFCRTKLHRKGSRNIFSFFTEES